MISFEQAANALMMKNIAVLDEFFLLAQSGGVQEVNEELTLTSSCELSINELKNKEVFEANSLRICVLMSNRKENELNEEQFLEMIQERIILSLRKFINQNVN